VDEGEQTDFVSDAPGARAGDAQRATVDVGFGAVPGGVGTEFFAGWVAVVGDLVAGVAVTFDAEEVEVCEGDLGEGGEGEDGGELHLEGKSLYWLIGLRVVCGVVTKCLVRKLLMVELVLDFERAGRTPLYTAISEFRCVRTTVVNYIYAPRCEKRSVAPPVCATLQGPCSLTERHSRSIYAQE
jgi:hypothetical protein